MSSISSVSSTTNPYAYQTTSQNSFSQIAQDFQAVGSALQSGDLSAAQSALTTFQQALQGSSSQSSNTNSQPFGKNSSANTDFQNLTSALQSGNLSGAQKAFASLQTDLKSAQSAHKGHHHHHHGASEASSAESSSSTPASSATTGTVSSLNATA